MAAANTIEDNFTRANQTGWGITTNTDSVPNVAWGTDADGRVIICGSAEGDTASTKL